MELVILACLLGLFYVLVHLARAYPLDSGSLVDGSLVKWHSSPVPLWPVDGGTPSRGSEGIAASAAPLAALVPAATSLGRLRAVSRSIVAGRTHPTGLYVTAPNLLPSEAVLTALRGSPLADLLPAPGAPIGYPPSVAVDDKWFRDLGVFAAARPESAALAAVAVDPPTCLLEISIAFRPSTGGLLPAFLRIFVSVEEDGTSCVGRHIYALDYDETGYEGHDHAARPATDADLKWLADAAAGFLTATAGA